MQYVQVKFRPSDTRAYTYENPGDPVAIGNEVKVSDNRSDGWKRVTVVGITGEEPPFACKPILGLAPAADEDSETLDQEF